MSSESVDALISENLASITNEDGSLRELPPDEQVDVNDGVEPARLVEPGSVEDAYDDAEEEETAVASDDETEADTETEESSYGSESDPFEPADIPDEFFKTKDGEVVSLKKAVEGYQKQAFVDKQIHRVKQLASEVEQMKERHAQTIQRQQQGMLRTVTSPEALDKFLQGYDPVARHDYFVKHYPEFYREVQEAGGIEAHRTQARLRRDQRQIEARRKQLDDQAQSSERNRILEQKRAIVAPAVKEAAASVGVALTSDMLRRIGPALDIEARALGRELTAEDIRNVSERWLRAYGEAPEKLERRARKPRKRAAQKVVQGTRKAPQTPNNVPKYDDFGNLNPQWILSQS